MESSIAEFLSSLQQITVLLPATHPERPFAVSASVIVLEGEDVYHVRAIG
jgi:hypothetical protein